MAEKEYTVVAPDGKEITLIGPEGATQEQVIAQAQKLYQPNQQTTPQESQKPTVEILPYEATFKEALQNVPESKRFMGSALAGLSGETIKNVGALTELVSPKYGKPIAQFGQAMSNVASEANPVMGTIGQIGAYAAPTSAIGKLMPSMTPISNALPKYLSLAPQMITNAGVGLGMGALLTEGTGQEGLKNRIETGMLNAAIGGGMPIIGAGISKLVKSLRGAEMSPQMIDAIKNARDLGYTVPPTQAGGGFLNRMLEGLAGKASTLQEASIRNQNVTNKLATKSLDLPEDTVLTPESLSAIRDKAGLAYEALKKLPKKPAVLADATMNRAAVAEINPAKLVEDLKIARKDAEAYYNAYARSAHPEDLAKAKTFKSKATQIEDTLENYAKDIGKEDLVPALRDARQLIAKTYTVENAMNKTTGTIDAKALANRLQKGKPMSEELKQVGQFAQAFPKATQMPEKIGGTIGISPLDFTAAGLTGGVSLLGGEDKATSGALSLAALLARPAARKIVLSAPMQNKLIQSPVNESSPYLSDLARALMLQQTTQGTQP
jgi:hypothetical protein